MSTKRRPSLLGALLWTGLGLLFLLRNFGIGPDAWSLAGRYWPLLLILLGLGKVLDYFLHKDAISIRPGEIIGIILILLVGSLITRVSESHMAKVFRDLPIQIGDASIQPGMWMGESHTYTDEVTYPLENPRPIRIENSHGAVSLSPGSDREIRVRLKKVVFAEESRAKNIAAEIHIETDSDGTDESRQGDTGKKGGSVFVVRTNREALSSQDYRFNTDIEVLVPKNCRLEVKNEFGEIRAADVDGWLTLSTTHRPLEVHDCTGQFDISTRYSDCRLVNLVGNVSLENRGKAYLDNIKGDVTVRNEFAPSEIYNVDGKLSITSSESRNIRIGKVTKPVVIDTRGTDLHVEDLQDTLEIESRYAAVTLKNIKGKVQINSNSDRISADDIAAGLQVRAHGSEIRVNGIRGPLDIQTQRKNVIVNNFSDACTISNEYGEISVTAPHLGKGDVNVKNRNGRIDMFLPEGAAFSIEATARNGKVESEYADLKSIRNDGGNGILNSRVKTGGPKILLENEGNDIRIFKATGEQEDRTTEEARLRVKRIRQLAAAF
jgi:hypothetical protein